MKAVTEFASFTLNKALTTKASLLAAGKTPEEIQTSLGETFKLEGEKLSYFVQAIEVATQNTTNLKRVLVVKLNEGETAPAKSTEVEGVHYVPEFLNLAPAKPAVKADGKFGGRGNQKSGPKSSPWGMSPEEKAAKNKKPAAAPKA